jgi:uncharacterized membrane protein
MIFIHVLAGFIVLILPIDFVVKSIFSVLIIGYYFLSRGINLNKIKAIKHHQNDQWFIFDQHHNKQIVTLSKNNFISNFLLILQFSNKQQLLLWQKQLNDDDWRMLQQLLRR